VAGWQKRALLVVVFAPAAILAGVVLALQDSIIAEIVPGAHHGMAYSKLAFSNADGDLVSGVLARGPRTAAAPKMIFATMRASFAAAGELISILRER
jgi:hypothetical protein